MATSPFIGQSLKEYLIDHKIESNINFILNTVIRQQPLDPYASMANLILKHSSADITLLGLKPIQTFNAEMQTFYTLQFTVQYLAQNYKVNPQIALPLDQQDLTDLHAFQIPLNTSLYQQKKLDELIKHFSSNLSQIISFSAQKVIALTTCQSPIFVYSKQFGSQPKVSNLWQTALVATKGRVCKLYFMFSEIQQGVHLGASIRKMLSSGKMGEAGVKQDLSGAYISPVETILENIKLMEDTIQAAGLKDSVKIALKFTADAMWQPDKLKYEVEGPKQLLDTDQMDKPVINCLEDPIFSGDILGYQKLQDKLKTIHVKISSKTLANSQEVFLNYAIYRMTDFKTMTELQQQWKSLNFRVNKVLKEQPCQMILENNVSDSQDTSYVDLAFALGCELCLVPPSKFERINAYNNYVLLDGLLKEQ